MYKLKRWQWITVACVLPLYFIFITFQVYGNFYLGYPPYTPAFLSHTKRPLERTLVVDKPSSLHIWGSLHEGRITLKLNGVIKREWVDDYDLRLTLPVGTTTLRLEMQEATGTLQYTLE